MNFRSREEEKVTKTHVRRIRTLRSDRNVFTGQKLLCENCCNTQLFLRFGLARMTSLRSLSRGSLGKSVDLLLGTIICECFSGYPNSQGSFCLKFFRFISKQVTLIPNSLVNLLNSGVTQIQLLPPHKIPDVVVIFIGSSNAFRCVVYLPWALFLLNMS